MGIHPYLGEANCICRNLGKDGSLSSDESLSIILLSTAGVIKRPDRESSICSATGGKFVHCESLMTALLAKDIEDQLISHGHVGNPAREVMRKLTLIFFRYIHSRETSYKITVGHRSFVVAPGVFTPSYRGIINTKASELLAMNLKVPTGARVLDMGTGIGIQGIFASERASTVVAVDINPQAVKCATGNAYLNGVSNMEVRCGDLFEPVARERFDFIVWLPPAFFIEPRNISEWAFACGRRGEVLARFCHRVGNHLSRDGVLQFSCVDRTRQFVLQHLQYNGFRTELIKKVTRLPMETCTQYMAWLH